MTESEIRESIVAHGRSLFARGYGCGTSGNLSARLADGFLMSPTKVALGQLQSDRLSRLDASGRHVDGPPPTKESWLHLAMYRSRPQDGAVVHLHSTYGVALSCRTDLPDQDALPAVTPYAVMRVGRVARVPYGRPGDASLSAAVAGLAVSHRALLLANHGPVVAGATFDEAVAAAEELEETARLVFVLAGHPHQLLTVEQIDDVVRTFGRP